MSRGRGIDGLSGTDKDKLLAGVRATRKAAKGRRPTELAAVRDAKRRAAFDFGELPAVRQMRMQRAAADLLGIENPYFRSHAGLAGSRTTIGNREYINFSSYDYLGLNGHQAVTDAAKSAIDQYGVSVSASRLVAGERPIHRDLERSLAEFLGVEDCVVMVSGHATNVTTIGHLLGPKDLILYDALIHNSVTEGARLSGATRRTFPHNDLDALEDMLGQMRDRAERVLIVVEGLYSMDGDMPDLPRLLSIKRRYDAWLMVDEAHSLGVLGATGRGLAEHWDVDPNEVELWMGTLSKTLCGCGGYIAGSTALIEYLKLSAPGFLYSVGMPGAVAAAAKVCLDILEREPERVARIRENGHRFVARARERGLDIGPSAGYCVVPVIVGESVSAAMLSQRLHDAGVNALPIIFPAVAERSARLRFFVTAAHTDEEIDTTVDLTAEALAEVRAAGSQLKKLVGDRVRS